MTIDELLARESIRKTMAAYTMAGDRLRIDEFLAVFTEDAVFETDGVPERDAFRYVGRSNIRNWLERWKPQADTPRVHQASFIRHHLSTCQIELTSPTTARARTYYVAYTDVGPDHGGAYLDSFEKVGDDWLIAHRRVRLDWRRDDSRYTTAVERTRT